MIAFKCSELKRREEKEAGEEGTDDRREQER